MIITSVSAAELAAFLRALREMEQGLVDMIAVYVKAVPMSKCISCFRVVPLCAFRFVWRVREPTSLECVHSPKNKMVRVADGISGWEPLEQHHVYLPSSVKAKVQAHL